MKRVGTILLCLLALLCTAFIWSNSAKPAVESSGQSLQILACVKGLLLSLGFDQEILHTLVRKAAHVTEFALLAGLWTAFAGRMWASDRKFAVVLPFALCLMTAAIDETIQLCFEGRAGMIQDLWVDLIGVAIGMAFAGLVFAGLVFAWRKRRR